MIVIAGLFTGLGWSGSSVGVTQPGNGHVIAGTPRPVRWDEWNVATPVVVAQSHHGYPTMNPDSIGVHDVGVILDIPTRSWPTIFRPWDYGIFFLDITHAFAFRWWAMSVVLLLGAYSLLLKLTARILPAILFSIVLWASPFFHWWYLDISLCTAGLAMAALASFLALCDARTVQAKIGLGLVCIWSSVAFVLILYPPFQIPLAIIIFCVGVADRWSTAPSWRTGVATVVPKLAVVGVTSAVILLLFYAEHRTAIHLINSTVYPGRRRDVGGTGSLYQYFSAPYGIEIARYGSSITASNQSELSSFIMVAPYLLIQLVRVRLRAFDYRMRLRIIGSLVALILLTAWYFLGLPGPLAHITGLDRVPAQRDIIGMGTAGLIMACLVAVGLRSAPINLRGRRSERPNGLRSDLVPGAVASALLAFGFTYWSGKLLAGAFTTLHIGNHEELASSAAVATIVLLLAIGKPIAGASLFAVLGIAVSLPANPLYSGLAPYTSPTVTAAFTSVPHAQLGGWLSFVNQPVSDVLVASGLKTVNAVNVYPNPSAWRILDPTGIDRHIWDRYANLSFVNEPSADHADLKLLQGDAIQIGLNPCGSELPRLDVRFIVSPVALSDGCLKAVRSTKVLGVPVFIYERVSA